MPAARSRSSLDRLLRVGERAVDQLAGARRVALEPLARELELDHQRDQPLLGAVVEVAAEPAALGVTGLDEPGARRAQRLQARAQLHLEPRVLDRQRGGRRGVAQQLRALAQAGSWIERADTAALVLDLRQHLSGPGSAAGGPSRRRSRCRSQ